MVKTPMPGVHVAGLDRVVGPFVRSGELPTAVGEGPGYPAETRIELLAPPCLGLFGLGSFGGTVLLVEQRHLVGTLTPCEITGGGVSSLHSRPRKATASAVKSSTEMVVSVPIGSPWSPGLFGSSAGYLTERSATACAGRTYGGTVGRCRPEARTRWNGRWWVLAVIVWTLFVWVGRIRNVLADDQTEGAAIGVLVLCASFVLPTLVLVASLLRRRGERWDPCRSGWRACWLVGCVLALEDGRDGHHRRASLRSWRCTPSSESSRCPSGRWPSVRCHFARSGQGLPCGESQVLR